MRKLKTSKLQLTSQAFQNTKPHIFSLKTERVTPVLNSLQCPGKSNFPFKSPFSHPFHNTPPKHHQHHHNIINITLRITLIHTKIILNSNPNRPKSSTHNHTFFQLQNITIPTIITTTTSMVINNNNNTHKNFLNQNKHHTKSHQNFGQLKNMIKT